MVVTYRTEPLDYEKVFNNLVDGIIRYVKDNGIKTLVLGISGGIDSTVTAALCHSAIEKGIQDVILAGFSLPCSTNQDDEINAASLVGKEFCTTFDEINLQKPFEVMRDFCKKAIQQVEETPISKGNIKARLRMLTLYDIASRTRGLVMGTSNKTEWLTGFWTLHGDVGDLNPIGELWKTEVYGLAKWMKGNVYKDSSALDASIALIPTDGNGVKAGGDTEQIMPGYTYGEIDHVLSVWYNLSDKIKPKYVADGFTDSIKGTVFDEEDEDVKNRRVEFCKKSGKEFVPTLGDLYGVESVRKVIMRSWNSEYKRRNLEVCINITDGNILLH